MKSILLSLFVLFVAVMIPYKMVSQATCPIPANLNTTNITGSSATLTWTSVAGTIANMVQYRAITVPESPWTNISSPSSSYTIDGLACGTHYQWRVASFCTSGTTIPGPYSPIINFTTSACNTTCPVPVNLQATNISTASATLSWTAVTGAMAYSVQYRLAIAAGAAWTTIHATAASITLSNLICGATYEWRVATTCGTTAGNTSPYSSTSTFVTVACTTNCPPPSGLSATNITAYSAHLSWIAASNASGYIIQYRPVTNPALPWINVSTQNPATSLTLTGLHCATAYQWHVAPICNNGTTTGGPYSPMAYFTTAPCATNCMAPTGLTASITAAATVLHWGAVSGAVSYTVQYRPVTTPSSSWVTATTQATLFTIANLPCGKNYQWHVKSICNTSSNAGSSPYSPMAYFNTPPCPANCIAPANLQTNVTPNGTVLSWTAVTGALSYLLQYRLNTVAAWTTVSTQSASLTLNGLNCGSSYTWRVASVCNTTATGTSPYSATAGFISHACPPCGAASGPGASNITATGATLSWTGISNAYAYIIQYRPVTNPSAAWINVNTQNPATNFSLTNLHCGTAYQWHVAAYCNTNPGAIGPYSAMAYFTTLPCTSPVCNTPTGLLSSTIPAIPGTVLSWTGSAGAAGYNLQYRPITSPSAPWITVTTTATTFTIFALACGVNYQWHVQAVCNTSSNNGTSPYSAMAYFTTLPCTTPVCTVPGGLTSSAVTTNSTSRMLNWNSAGASTYNIRYRILNAANWVTTTSTTNSKLINGLQLNSHYEWQVQSVCTTNNGTVVSSAWTQSANFVTPISRPVYPNPASGSTIRLPLALQNDGNIRITLTDHMGRAVKIVDRTISKGNMFVDIDIADLETGIYLVNINNDSRNEIQKLSIVR